MGYSSRDKANLILTDGFGRLPRAGCREPKSAAPINTALCQVRVLGEKRKLVAIGQPPLAFASWALKDGDCYEPSPFSDYQITAEIAFKGEIDMAKLCGCYRLRKAPHPSGGSAKPLSVIDA